MFFKKKKNNELRYQDVKEFVVPQIDKPVTSGIRSNKKPEFQNTRFISPVFGDSVKDETIIQVSKLDGDIINRYDSFRDHKKNNVRQKSFDEFGTTIISHETRKELFGSDVTIVRKKESHKKETDILSSLVKTRDDYDDEKKSEYSREEELRFANKDERVDPLSISEKEPTLREAPHYTSSKPSPYDEYYETLSKPVEKKIEKKPSFFEDNYAKDKTPERTKVPSFLSRVNSFERESFVGKTVKIDEKEPINDVPIYEETIEIPSKKIETGYESSSTSYKDDPVYRHVPKREYYPEISEASKEIVEPRTDYHHEAKTELPKVSYEYYKCPPLSLLNKVPFNRHDKPAWIDEQIDIINNTLAQFEIDGCVDTFTKGPAVTRYEIKLKPGINVKKVVGIQDNIKMALSAKTIRIEAPIPGKSNIGVEVPNVKAEAVTFGTIVASEEFQNSNKPLNVGIGLTIDGEVVFKDITKMPHGLIAGTTGSGKSVCVNTILLSLLMKNSPDDLRLILVDPKVVELMAYNNLPHLITPVINDPKLAMGALKWAVKEMERRYRLFAEVLAKDIVSYNEKIKTSSGAQKMYYIVIVIDELADLMMVASNEVEEAIQRLTQKSRACGIHLLVATQRPSADVVKGGIKANIPTRFAFKVASPTDSIVILGGGGAESLLGRGDMLINEGDINVRIQGAYVPDSEIEAVTTYIKQQYKPDYLFQHESLAESEVKNDDGDDLLYSVACYVVENGVASINRIQREFSLGFNRAQHIVELLTRKGIVSPGQGSKARDVLVGFDELEDIFR